MAIDSAPSAARVATKIIRTSRVAADRPRMIPRTLTMPSWLPRMKSERTVGFGCVARSLAMFASMAGPSRGTGKPFSLETSRSYGPAAAVVCPGPSRSAEGCSRTEAYKPPLVSGTVRPRRHARPAAEDPMANFRIENVVASTSLGRELDLKAIALALCGSEYEPEQFPGLVYRIDEPKVVLLMFGSGKVVCTGARKPADVEKAVEKITAELKANGLLH